MTEKATPYGHRSDRELLVKLAIQSDVTSNDIRWIKKILGNHLKHHQAYEIALVIGIILLVIERFIF